MKAILFDWDGTIVDSVPALYATDEAICRRIGVPFDQAIFRRTFSPNWRRMYDLLGIPKDRVDDAVQVWSETFRADLMQPFDGVQAALARLASTGRTLGIVTGGSRPEIEPQLDRLGLDELLTVRVYGHDTPDGKPHPSALRLALDMCGPIRPDQAIYIGDALDDVRMAAAAGVRGVGIVSMLANADQLVAAGAVETAGSVAEWVDSYLSPAASRERPTGTSSPEPGPRV
ncbi:MAG TPA: HAD family hydrolase [Candidatus Limnocylindrales bacterium]